MEIVVYGKSDTGCSTGNHTARKNEHDNAESIECVSGKNEYQIFQLIKRMLFHCDTFFLIVFG